MASTFAAIRHCVQTTAALWSVSVIVFASTSCNRGRATGSLPSGEMSRLNETTAVAEASGGIPSGHLHTMSLSKDDSRRIRPSIRPLQLSVYKKSIYSSLAADKEGNVYLLFESGEKKLYETITFARFKHDWVFDQEQ